MKSIGIKICSFALLIFTSSLGVAAQSVFVRTPLGDSETASNRATVFELIKAAVSGDSNYTLSSSAQGAQIQLAPKLLKLGSVYILSIDKVKGEQIVFTAKVNAASIEDLDAVSTRAVRSVLQEVKVEDSAQIDDVTEDEVTRGTRRTKVVNQFKFAFGPVWGSNLNTEKSGTMGSFVWVYGLDAQMEASMGLSLAGFDKAGESGATYLEGIAGFNYFLNKNKHAPFLIFGLGWVSAVGSSPGVSLLDKERRDGADGFAVKLGAGFKFYRTSTFSLGFELTHSTTLSATTSKSDKRPGLSALAMNIYY